MHQSASPEPMSDSDFNRLDFDVTQAPDRRINDDALIDLVREMFVELKQMRQDLHLHIQDEDMILRRAFPGNDPEFHRRIHEEQLRVAEAKTRKAEAQAAIWANAKTTLIAAGILGLGLWLLNIVWEAILRGPPK